VGGIDSSNDNAKVGLMFRESLNDDSDMITVHGHNTGQTHATWREVQTGKT